MRFSDLEESEWDANELVQQACTAFQVVNESKTILLRRQFDYSWPYFTLFGLATILAYSSGQYLPDDVIWLSTGASWILLGPVLSIIAYQWYRHEQLRDGVVSLHLPALDYWRFYLPAIALIGTSVTLMLSFLDLSKYTFPAWVLIVSGVYISWGWQLDRRLTVLGILNSVVILGVSIWWLNYSYLLLSLSTGGGNLLLGITARQHLAWQRRHYNLHLGKIKNGEAKQ